MSDRDIRTIPLADAAKLHARSVTEPTVALFVDPRSPASYAKGHIPGARNLVLSAADQDRGTDPSINRYETLVVYGDHPGSAGAKAMAKRLMTAGYSKKKVKLLGEGLSAWESAGLPVDADE
ncbi:MAG: hypothetical protein DHS20C14_11120 [Phycisphaeraceae bacterium]|nr:MAG: hypothetical protein DHS20C14_11120 [Phycisphaeraceae bacterium]